MPVTCPIDLDVTTLRKEVQSIYARVAAAPDGAFHFHRGSEYAAGGRAQIQSSRTAPGGTTKERTARRYGVMGVNLLATR